MKQKPNKEQTKLSGDGVYQILKKRLSALKYRPGQSLQELEISTELNASRTPVRYAFSKLESEGLVEIIPRKGAFVKYLSVKDAIEMYQVTGVLEGLAARLATELVDLKDLEELENIHLNALKKNSSENIQEFIEHNTRFHRFVVKNSGNHRIEKMLDSIQVLRAMSRYYLFNQNFQIDESRIKEPLGEHLAVIEAMKKRDPEELAEVRMRAHITNAAHAALSFSPFKKEVSSFNRD